MATTNGGVFDGPISAVATTYFQAANGDGRERVPLYRLAWDITCSGFGGPEELYERYSFGDPVRMMSTLYFGYDKGPLKERINRFLHQEDGESPVAGKAAFVETR